MHRRCSWRIVAMFLAMQSVAAAGEPLPALTSVADVGLGVDFTCSLDRRGVASCWGSNEFGQLGLPDGTLSDRTTPVPVSSAGSGLRGLAVGAFHACAITTAGGAKCWGRDLFGALGDGPEDNGPAAVDVVGLRGPVQALSAGVAHSCALLVDGTVQCWGYNQFGQLGDGTAVEERTTAVDVVDLGGSAVAIEAGDVHTCAVLAGGGVRCWGDNEYGQLGDGTLERRLRPVPVQGLTAPVTRLAAAGRATCALSNAGAVLCWGPEYPLGAFEGGSRIARLYPGFEAGFVAIDAGVFHVCALRSDNAIKCLGDGLLGQFGNGPIDGSLGSDIAVGVAPGIVQVAAGGRHTCARSGAGGLQCWGLNTNGQLGIGSHTRRLVPTPVVGLASGSAAVTAGGTHSCGLSTSGAVKCWGANNQDSIGDGTERLRLTPVNVIGLGAGVRAVAAGVDHTCAIDAQGRVLCWGANFDGRLGNGETLNRGEPVLVQGLGSAAATAIAVGGSHACALLEGGAVKCWGTNAFGQLGDGSQTTRLGAVDVVGLDSGVVAISAGYYYSCAITSAGRLKCWGENTSGQLGDGSNTHRSTPTDVVGLSSGVQAVASGDQHTCAIVAGGAVKCWGFNFFGLVLGDQSTVDRNVPGDVPALSGGVVELALGAYASCVRLQDGSVRCWGVNPIGDNTELARPTPTEVAGLEESVTDVDIGFGGHLCVVVAGATRCWGPNLGGQIGDGSTDGVPTPQVVVSNDLERRVSAVAAAPNGPATASRSDASGRYVVYQSTATNLVPGDTNGASDIFLTDRETGVTERVSVDQAGAQLSGPSIEPSISADGTVVVFVAPDAAVGALLGEPSSKRAARRKSSHYAVLMRNLVARSTQRMGIAMAGGAGTTPQIAPGATAVVFTSNGADGTAGGMSNVYHVPLAASGPPAAPTLTPGPLRCVSCKAVAANGTDTPEDANGHSRNAVVTADGRYVAFETQAKNALASVPSPCPGSSAEIMLRDLLTGAMSRVSPPPALPATACGSVGSTAPSIDHAATVIAFQSDQALAASDGNGDSDIYLVTPSTATAPVLLSRGADGSDGNGASIAPDVSGDGRSVAFVSAAQNLDVGFADNNDRSDVHAVLVADPTSLVRLSRSLSGAEANAPSEAPALNFDGSRVAFDSAASTLAGVISGASNVYQRSNPLVPPLKSGTWWKSSETGWGLTVFDQGNVLAPTWFTFDADGEPTWFIVGGAFLQSDGSYRGDLLRFTGTRYDQISGPAATSATSIGNVVLRYSGERALQFQYTADGVTQSKALERFPFGARDFSCTVSPDGDRSGSANYTDLWTGGDAANAGWGLTLFHIDSGIFAIWYTYDLDGEATFFVIATSRQSDGSFTGTIFRQRNGTPFLQIADQPASPASDPVGNATFRFDDGDSASFSYALGGVSQTKPIVRLLVGSRPTDCQTVTPLP